MKVHNMVIKLYDIFILFIKNNNIIDIKVATINMIPPIVGVSFLFLCSFNKYSLIICSCFFLLRIGIKTIPIVIDIKKLIIVARDDFVIISIVSPIKYMR